MLDRWCISRQNSCNGVRQWWAFVDLAYNVLLKIEFSNMNRGEAFMRTHSSRDFDAYNKFGY